MTSFAEPYCNIAIHYLVKMKFPQLKSCLGIQCKTYFQHTVAPFLLNGNWIASSQNIRGFHHLLQYSCSLRNLRWLQRRWLQRCSLKQRCGIFTDIGPHCRSYYKTRSGHILICNRRCLRRHIPPLWRWTHLVLTQLAMLLRRSNPPPPLLRAQSAICHSIGSSSHHLLPAKNAVLKSSVEISYITKIKFTK